MRVLDLGGTLEWWRRAPLRPAQVITVNLEDQDSGSDRSLRHVTGDACTAREVLDAAGLSREFDLVFSNSLIEHVGGHARRAELAHQIQDLAPNHWIQTPYRYFPVEPHWLFPGMQFLPMAARSRIALSWPLTHTRAKTLAEARDGAMWTELIGLTEIRSYFPDSEIAIERFLGIPKSLIAIKA
ncbi:hypothetical protein [Antricoccus suffuscus]|nr:hypothetical protein [Antricoccus suffuscus]